MYVIMVYDVCQNDNGRKRWSHIFKTCKNICPIFKIRYLKANCPMCS